MPPAKHFSSRRTEALLLFFVTLVAFLGFTLVEVAGLSGEADTLSAALWRAWKPPLVLTLALLSVHVALRLRRVYGEQLILPLVGLLIAVGLTVQWRLLPAPVIWQQLTRGLLPGTLSLIVFISSPRLIERIRRDWPVTVSFLGLLLLLATALFGVIDEAGARLALKVSPFPAIQTSELIKLALIIFLAWYLESEGEAASGRALTIGWLRLPPVRYFIPGLLFVALATLALVRMSDFGAVLILGLLFLVMLYAAFERRIFYTILGIGLVLIFTMATLLIAVDGVPTVIQHRFLAFLDPWSNAPLMVNGVATGVTVAEGPGYQLQQSIYAISDGGLLGTGLGLGTPQFVPLAHSDFILAAITEELGAAGTLAILACFIVLLLRILRLAIILPAPQVFERLLLVGISVHLLAQLFVMGGGTVNLLPATGVTIPFLSQGGMAMLVNLTEIGMVLALAQRIEPRQL